MFRARTATIALAFVTVLGLGSVSAPAFAGGPDDEKPIVDEDKPRFPMDAAEFNKKVEARIHKAMEHLDRALARRKLPEPVEQAVRAEAARIAELVRTAAREATADGSVTKEEAKHVREVARTALREAREKYSQYLPKKDAQKGHKGKGKGKGKANRQRAAG